MNELVSIIIPTCQRPTFLLRAIDSIKRQTYDNIEIIVIDDNGINSLYQTETHNLLSDYIATKQIIYFALPTNMGVSIARNKGIELSKGRYIGFLDDDDEFLPEKISFQVKKLLQSTDNIGGCYTRQQYIFNNHTYPIIDEGNFEGNLALDILLLRNKINTSSLLFKREVLLDLNGFDANLLRHQDWDLLLRFFNKYLICLDDSDKPLLNRYTDATSFQPIGLSIVDKKQKFIDAIEQYISVRDDSSLILKTQWMDASTQLFRQNHVFLGLKTAIKAHQYYPLNIKEWKWVVARFIKNLFKKYKQTL
jgi:glycosyltransferase involved in cell wall biosynthesis